MPVLIAIVSSLIRYGLWVVTMSLLLGKALLKYSKLCSKRFCDFGNKFCSGSSTILMKADLLNFEESADKAMRLCSSVKFTSDQIFETSSSNRFASSVLILLG